MKKIGIVAAVEVFAVGDLYGPADQKYSVGGFNVRRFNRYDYEIYVVKSGVGQIAAAAATQLLITGFEVECIFNFGTAGAVDFKYPEGAICIVDKVVHHDFDCSEMSAGLVPGRHAEFSERYIMTDRKMCKAADEILKNAGIEAASGVACASGDKLVKKEYSRRRIAELFDASIVEMEAAAVIITCSMNRMPCLVLKCISDTVSTPEDRLGEAFEEAAEKCFEALDTILKGL